MTFRRTSLIEVESYNSSVGRITVKGGQTSTSVAAKKGRHQLDKLTVQGSKKGFRDNNQEKVHLTDIMNQYMSEKEHGMADMTA